MKVGLLKNLVHEVCIFSLIALIDPVNDFHLRVYFFIFNYFLQTECCLLKCRTWIYNENSIYFSLKISPNPHAATLQGFP